MSNNFIESQHMKICNSYGDTSRHIEETALWLAMIKQVVDEAVKGDKVALAKIFSKNYEEGFQYLCDLSDIDMGYMRRKIKDRLDREEARKAGVL